jgi:hypothetical protein
MSFGGNNLIIRRRGHSPMDNLKKYCLRSGFMEKKGYRENQGFIVM